MIKVKWRIFPFLILCCWGTLSRANNLCSSVFDTQSYLPQILDSSFISFQKQKKLSENDLKLLVEKYFNKTQGPIHKFSDYKTLSAQERTLKTMERQIAETITQHGLLHYFRENTLMRSSSQIKSRLILINRSKSFNIATGLWSVGVAMRGVPPIFLPEATFKMRKEEVQTLLLKGTQSPEGQALLQKYQIRYEINRGYDLFSRYYQRLALAVFAFIAYEKVADLIKENPEATPESLFDEVVENINKRYSNEKISESKEEILMEVILNNFHKSYNRLPDSSEMEQICLKVYGHKECTKAPSSTDHPLQGQFFGS